MSETSKIFTVVMKGNGKTRSINTLTNIPPVENITAAQVRQFGSNYQAYIDSEVELSDAYYTTTTRDYVDLS